MNVRIQLYLESNKRIVIKFRTTFIQQLLSFYKFSLIYFKPQVTLLSFNYFTITSIYAVNFMLKAILFEIFFAKIFGLNDQLFAMGSFHLVEYIGSIELRTVSNCKHFLSQANNNTHETYKFLQ